jgi:RND family efflux transporter MFP subunit
MDHPARHESRERDADATASGVFAVLLGIASIVGVGWWLTRAPAPPPPPPAHPPFVVPVTTVPLARGDVVEFAELVGDVLAPERARVAFERAGRLAELPIVLGQVVRRGDLLARLDDEVMAHEVRAAEAALEQARTMAALAERDVARLRDLRDVDVSAAALDRAEAGARNEAAKVRQLEADLALQQARRRQGRLTAPFDAQVTSRPTAPGDYVAAGDLCCELLPLLQREVVLELPAALVGEVRVGASAEIHSDAHPERQLTAPLAALLPAVDPRGRTFRAIVRAEVGAAELDWLQPGLYVRARIERRAARGALVVPVDALLERRDGMQVVRFDPGETGKPGGAAFVPVTVQARDARHAAIAPAGSERLDEGAAIVLIGKENVRPGALVQAVGGAPRGALAPAR